MATRKADPLDAMVGDRTRMLRVNRGMSQATLAARIGVTFRAGRFDRRAVRIIPDRISPLEFTDSNACRARRLACSQCLCAHAQSARAALHREAG
jgi:hypothetical protein